MQNDEFKLYHDTRNFKRRKYLKYNNKCGYNRKGSPGCSYCHPKQNNNTGLIDFNTLDRQYKNTKKNVYINCYEENGESKNNPLKARIHLLTSSYY